MVGTWVMTLLACLFVGVGAARDEGKEKEEKRWTDAEAGKALEDFEFTYRRQDFEFPILLEMNQVKAIEEVSKVDHRLIAKRLVSLLTVKQDRVWLAAVAGLEKMRQDPGLVIGKLSKHYDPRKAPPPRTAAIVHAFGELKAKKMVGGILKLLAHPDEQVALEAVVALGKIGDPSVLPQLREFFELNSLDPKTGVSVRVDTGAAGSRDARAARAAGKRMESLRRKNRDQILAAIRKALQRITEQEFKTPEELRAWMKKNKRIWR